MITMIANTDNAMVYHLAREEEELLLGGVLGLLNTGLVILDENQFV